MKMKKMISALLLAAVMASTLAACGEEKTGDAAASGEALTGQTLQVMLSEEPSTLSALMTTLNKWADETGNKIETIVIPYDDQLTKFPLMAKNQDLPDLIYTTRMTRLYPEEFVDLGDVVDTSIFEEQAIKIISQDYESDANLCLPIQFTITTTYYNADAFEKAGIEVPTEDAPWTLEEMYANAEKLQADGGVKYGAAMDFSRARYDNFMYMNGGSMVEKDGDTFDVTINSDENIATLEKFVEMNDKGVIPKAIWAGGSTDNPADYFQNGDVGIYFSGSWNYNTFTEDITGMNWGIMPSVKGTSSYSAILGGSGLAVPKEAKNKALAENFIEWLYGNPENFEEYLKLDKGLSSLKSVTFTPEDPKVAADYAIMQSEVTKVPETFIVDESSNWRNFKDNEYRDYLKQAVNGDMSAEEALNGFAKELSEKSDWEIKN